MTASFIPTPWDEETIEALMKYQTSGKYHPYTCGNGQHRLDRPVLVPTKGGFICPGLVSEGIEAPEECFYTQQWALRSSLTI